jgi:hypothetical protein
MGFPTVEWSWPANFAFEDRFRSRSFDEILRDYEFRRKGKLGAAISLSKFAQEAFGKRGARLPEPHQNSGIRAMSVHLRRRVKYGKVADIK